MVEKRAYIIGILPFNSISQLVINYISNENKEIFEIPIKTKSIAPDLP